MQTRFFARSVATAILATSLAACGSAESMIDETVTETNELGWRRPPKKPVKVEICHRKLIPRLRYMPMLLPECAIPAHLAHGDILAADNDERACGPSCVPCTIDQVCIDGACCAPLTCEQEGVTCGIIEDGCGGVIECGTCPEGQVCTGGVCELACNPTPGVLDGHYEGNGVITSFRAVGADWPICATEEYGETTFATLGVTTDPTFAAAIDFPFFGGLPYLIELPRDFFSEGYEWWLPSASRAELWWLCEMDGYSNLEPAIIELYPGPGSVRVDIVCSKSHLDECGHPYNWVSTYSFVLERTCIPNSCAEPCD
jgi:hypothetical protein